MKVTVRGFLYQGIQGEWILSQEPHLKSCCINSKAKASEQILVEGDLYPSNRVVSVSGTVKVADGRILMTDAKIEAPSSAWVGWIIAFAVCGVLLAVWLRRKQHLVNAAS